MLAELFDCYLLHLIYVIVNIYNKQLKEWICFFYTQIKKS